MLIEFNHEQHQQLQALVAAGRFPSAEAALAEAVALLKAREQWRAEKLAELEATLAVGEEELDEGEGVDFSSEEEHQAYFRSVLDRALTMAEAKQRQAS